MPKPKRTKPTRRQHHPHRAPSDTQAESRCAPKRPDIQLNVIGPDGAKMKRSKTGPWRAASLIAVHLIVIAHVIHYLVAGKTLSPVEPSESMYTLELGQVNAGFIFFAVVLLATLIAGRFFCGWACHLVAYQDLCGWIMKKLGVKPKPFRSRLLLFVPLVLALYMFVWPNFKRILFQSDTFANAVAASPNVLGFIFTTPAKFPGWSDHLATDAFWKTFPGPLFAVLTFLVCGFVAVYFLGAKGFCTYGCPYGGFFAVLDKAAPTRIRVTDACQHCGHCTANCTSNVRVHEEVKRYGMVVDPGCMKCMDCVSVCPNDALYVGVGTPALLKLNAAQKREPDTPPPNPKYDLTLTEELAVLLVFLLATPAYRGLYGGPPLLMSVAMGGVTAYIAFKLWRLLRDPTVRLQNLKLKVAGKLKTTGAIFAAASILWFTFTAHSAVVQFNLIAGRHHLQFVATPPEAVFQGRFQPGVDTMDEHAVAMMHRFETADRWSLIATPEVKRALAWTSLLKGDLDRAERLCRDAIHSDPDQRAFYQDLINVLQFKGKPQAAVDAYRDMLDHIKPVAHDHFQLAGMLAAIGRVNEAAEQYKACIQKAPDAPEAYYNLGGLLGRAGQFNDAVQHLQHADRLQPDDVETKMELALALNGAGRLKEAVAALEDAVRLDPQNPQPKMLLDAMRAQAPPR